MKNLNLGNIAFVIVSLAIVVIGIKFVSEVASQAIVLY